MIELTTATVLWFVFFSYLIISAVDFGAAALWGWARMTNQGSLAWLLRRYLTAPTEVVNLLFVLALIPLLLQFNGAFGEYIDALIMPGFVVLVILFGRGIILVTNPGGVSDTKMFAWINAILAIILPALMSTIFAVSEGGYFITQSNGKVLDFSMMLTDFYFWSVIFLAIVSVLYIGAAFLTLLAGEETTHSLEKLLRILVLVLSVPTLVASALVFVALQQHNPEHFLRMLDVSWLFMLSLVCLLGAISWVFRKPKSKLTFVFVYFQFYFAFLGYGVSHLPYAIYPVATISSGQANQLLLWFVILIGTLFPAALLAFKIWVTGFGMTKKQIK